MLMCTSGLFTFSAGLLRAFDNKATFMQNPDLAAKVPPSEVAHLKTLPSIISPRAADAAGLLVSCRSE